jgi:hypothetical protein
MSASEEESRTTAHLVEPLLQDEGKHVAICCPERGRGGGDATEEGVDVGDDEACNDNEVLAKQERRLLCERVRLRA